MTARNIVFNGSLMAILILAFSCLAQASANVLMMPERDAVKGEAIVVWGNTKFANRTAFKLSFGDGTPDLTGTVEDQSYIATTHAYSFEGAYLATLTIGSESETAKVNVFDPQNTTPESLRLIRINMAIQDGLRALYYGQYNRAGAFLTNQTSWTRESYGDPDFYMSWTSMVLLAFQNHGHSRSNDVTKDIYAEVVARGLNFLFDNLVIVPLGSETHGPPDVLGGTGPARVDDPCINVPSDGDKCTGLGAPQNFHSMYATAVTALAIAGATAKDPFILVPAGVGVGSGNFVTGRPYREILQRLVNTIAWGGVDSGSGRGGFYYYLDGPNFDGSTLGWAVLALLDAQAAGAQVPSYVASEMAFGVAGATVDLGNGEFGMAYNIGSQATNVARTGILLQALHFMNVPAADPRVQGAITYLGNHWYTPAQEDYRCGLHNLGCAYDMFNAFKGLKLYNVTTLSVPPPLRSEVPQGNVDLDWFAAYQDWLKDNQTAPTSPTGGFWQPFSTNTPMNWSCCADDMIGITAAAELILSPVALVRPSILLLDVTSAKAAQGAQATITATAKTEGGGLVPGVTITFKVLSGPNAGFTGSVITDANGTATFRYTGTGGAGTDKIQASVTTLTSTIVDVIWKKLPVFTPTTNKGTRPGRDVTFNVAAADPDGVDAVTISTGPLPEGATFNASTGTFSWPMSGGQGPVTVQFMAQYTSYPAPKPVTMNVVIGRYPSSGSLDPNNPDTDGDGVNDGTELANFSDPLDPNSK